ncbi:hypothetical protein PM082_001158 [Marasmius tenuissimus]|nr:hypothetical protein PM082_001158 [Marasmius tenuissimus]
MTINTTTSSQPLPPTQPKNRLFDPIKLGDLTLSHRIVHGPLQRFRSDENHVPIVPLMKEYYSQRASKPGTFMITESTYIHPRAAGMKHTPGIWSDEQIAAWKDIVHAVHEKGSYIFLQMWALGRAAKPEDMLSQDRDSSCDEKPETYPYVSSSNIPISWRPSDSPHPRPLNETEIREYTHLFADAAKNAVHKAGFDGVEVHGANGYLIEQFLKESCNNRTDEYGGSPEKRARFALEVIEAVVKAVGPRKVGVRLSPWNTFQDTRDEDPTPTYSYLVKELRKDHPNLAYIHVVDPRIDGVTEVDPGTRSNDFIREIWSGATKNEDEGTDEGRQFTLITAGSFSDIASEVVDLPDDAITRKGDLMAFGRWFITNPDLPYRLQNKIPLTPYDRSKFYIHGSRDPKWYTDYPFVRRGKNKENGGATRN